MKVKLPFVAFPYLRGSILVFLSLALSLAVQAATITAKADGNWTSSGVWDLARVPAAGDNVVIPLGRKIIYNSTSTAGIRTLTLYGTLEFSRSMSTNLNVGLIKIGASAADGTLDCDGVHHPTAPQEGALIIGKPGSPIPSPYKAVINLIDTDLSDTDAPAICNCAGTMTVQGATIKNPWVKMSASAAVGATTVNVTGDITDWKVNDKIIIVASRNNKSKFADNPPSYRTSLDHKPETEERTITAISGQTITFNAGLVYSHAGHSGNFPEVANLSRTVTIKSAAVETSATRGHVFVLPNSSGSIAYAQFDGLGKEGILGRYPLHLHHSGATLRGMSIVGNSITNSHNKFVAVHRTHYMVLRDNVGYKGIASGFFLEDGTETYNVLDRNLAVLTMNGASAPNEALSFLSGNGFGFWWANGRNTFINNVAAENDDFGFLYEMRKVNYYDGATFTSPRHVDAPMLNESGSTTLTRINTIPFFQFKNNESHADHHWSFQVRGGKWTLDKPTILKNSKIWTSHYPITIKSDGVLVDGLTVDNSNYGLDIKANYDGDKRQTDNITFRNTHINLASVNAILLTPAGKNVNFVNCSIKASGGKIWLPNFSHDYPAQVVFDGFTEDYTGPFIKERDNKPTSSFTSVTWFNNRYGSNSAAKVVLADRASGLGDGLTYGVDSDLTMTSIDNDPLRAITTNNTNYTIPVQVDDLKPATVITSFGGGTKVRDAVITSGQLVVEGTSSDNGTITSVKVNGVSATALESDFSKWRVVLSGLSAGAYTVTAHATDAAGNIETNPHSVNLKLVSSSSTISSFTKDDLSLSNNESEFRVFPNPSNGSFTVQFLSEEAGSGEITVSNSNGVLNFKQDIKIVRGTNSQSYQLNDLVSGVYILNISSAGTLLTTKLLVVK
jgi:hypothetical protein